MPTGISDANPFVGPRPIARGEPIYGRDREIDEVFALLQARRIVTLHSPSGAGKSSLVQAGLVPELRAAGFDPWKPIRLNLDPEGLGGVPEGVNRYLLSAMVSLEEELPEERRRPPGALAGLDFAEYLDRRPRRKAPHPRPVVLLFDQFEEILTADPLAEAQRRAFFQALGRALDGGRRWALFIIREDYLPALAPYREHVPTQLANSYRLGLLGLDAAASCARSLAEGGGRAFPAAPRLVQDLSTVQVQGVDGRLEPQRGLYVEPVHLQVVCRRLWDAMPADDLSIDAEDVEAYADVSTALAAYYAEGVRRASRGDLLRERAIREWVGRKLIVGGGRALVRRGPEESGGLDNESIEALRRSYLIRAEQRAGAQWFELSHDRLVEPLIEDNAAWEEEHLHPVQVQAKLWEAQGRPDALLLGQESVAQAITWAEANPGQLTGGERDYLLRSRIQRDEERRTSARLRLLALVAVGVSLLALAGAGASFWQYREAQAAQQEAVAQREIARDAERRALGEARRARDSSRLVQALGHLDSNPVLSIAILREMEDPQAAGFAPTAVRALHEVVPVTVEDYATPLGLQADAQVVLSPGGERALVVQPDGGDLSLIRRDEGGALSMVELPGHPIPTALAFSPDGQRVAVGSGDGRARLFQVDGRDKASPPELRGVGQEAIVSVAFSPDGERIALGSASGAQVWRLKEGAWERAFELRPGRRLEDIAVAFDPGGALLAAGYDGGLRLWRAGEGGAGEPVVLMWSVGAGVRLALSPDGERVASGTIDGVVRVWRTDGSDAFKPTLLWGHEADVTDVAFSPDGSRLVSSSLDGTALVWSVDGGDQDKPIILYDQPCPPRQVQFTRGGRAVVTVSCAAEVREWALDALDAPRYPAPPSQGDGAALDPGGSRLAAGWDDSGAPVSALDSGELLSRLWAKTRFCLSAEGSSPTSRQRLFGEDDETAERNHRACQCEVARLQGLPPPAYCQGDVP